MGRACEVCAQQGRKSRMRDGIRHIHELEEGTRFRLQDRDKEGVVTRVSPDRVEVLYSGSTSQRIAPGAMVEVVGEVSAAAAPGEDEQVLTVAFNARPWGVWQWDERYLDQVLERRFRRRGRGSQVVVTARREVLEEMRNHLRDKYEMRTGCDPDLYNDYYACGTAADQIDEALKAKERLE